MPFSNLPWYGQVVVWIVLALIAVYLFQNIVLPLLGQIT